MSDTLPTKASDKRVVNGKGDINQLMPLRYPWAWQFYLNGNANHWMPTEIPMGPDIADYRTLTPAEKHVYENVLAYLTTSDILAMRNIGLAIMEKMTAPELQIYQARQVFDEAVHTHSYQHCIENLGLDQGEIYNRYRVVPEIYRKIELSNRRLGAVLHSDIDLSGKHALHTFAMSYLFFAAVFEGVWFFNGFNPIFAFQRRGLMKATGEMFQYILRDECVTPDTDVLTERGWVGISEITETDTVLQYNEGGGCEFVTPSRVVSMPYEGEMFHFKSEQGHYDLTVTPNHRMVTLNKHMEHRVVFAKDCKAHPYMHFVVASGAATSSPITPQQRLAIAYQADGAVITSRYNGANCGYVRGFISVKKEIKAKRLRDILGLCDFEWSESSDDRGYKNFRINFPIPSIWIMSKEFNWVDLGGMSCGQASAFIEEVSHWDGSIPDLNRVRYDNTNKAAADIVQAIATLAGFRTLRKVIQDNRSESYSDVHRVNIVKHRTTVQGGTVQKMAVNYAGQVYCVTVPSGMFIVRRNGAVMVTGNSMHSSFGLKVIKTMLEEEDLTLNQADVDEMWRECHEAEEAYIKYVLRTPILGYSVDMHMGQFRYVANRRMRTMGLPDPYPGAEDCLPWLDDQTGGTKKEKNFFEGRVIDYQTGGALEWD